MSSSSSSVSGKRPFSSTCSEHLGTPEVSLPKRRACLNEAFSTQSFGPSSESQLLSKVPEQLIFQIIDMAAELVLSQTSSQFRKLVYKNEFQKCKAFALDRFGIERPLGNAPFEGGKTIAQVIAWKRTMVYWILDRARFVASLDQVLSDLRVDALCAEQKRIALQLSEASKTSIESWLVRGDVFALQSMEFPQGENLCFYVQSFCDFFRMRDRRVNRRLFWATDFRKIEPQIWLQCFRDRQQRLEGAVYALEQSLIAHPNGSICVLGKELWDRFLSSSRIGPMIGVFLGAMGMQWLEKSSSISDDLKRLGAVPAGIVTVLSFYSLFQSSTGQSSSHDLKIEKIMRYSLLSRIGNKIAQFIPQPLTSLLQYVVDKGG